MPKCGEFGAILAPRAKKRQSGDFSPARRNGEIRRKTQKIAISPLWRKIAAPAKNRQSGDFLAFFENFWRRGEMAIFYVLRRISPFRRKNRRAAKNRQSGDFLAFFEKFWRHGEMAIFGVLWRISPFRRENRRARGAKLAPNSPHFGCQRQGLKLRVRQDVSNYFDQVSIEFTFDKSLQSFDTMCRTQIIKDLAQYSQCFT